MAENEEIKKARLNASIDPKDFDWEAFEGGEVPGEDREKIKEAYAAKTAADGVSYDEAWVAAVDAARAAVA